MKLKMDRPEVQAWTNMIYLKNLSHTLKIENPDSVSSPSRRMKSGGFRSPTKRRRGGLKLGGNE